MGLGEYLKVHSAFCIGFYTPQGEGQAQCYTERDGLSMVYHLDADLQASGENAPNLPVM